jgi:hypothetical protein
MNPKNPLFEFLKFLLSFFTANSLKKDLNGKIRLSNTFTDTRYIRQWGIATLMLLSISFISWGQVNGDYRTRANGNWNDFNVWQVYNGAWNNCAAGDYPGAAAGAGTVTVLNNNSVTLTNNPPNAIGSLTFPAATANNTVLTLTGQTLNVTGAVSFGVPSVDGTGQRIDLGTGVLNCSSVTMPTTASALRTIDIIISTGTLNVTGNILMNGASDRNNITFSSNGVLNVGGNFTDG